MGKPSRRKAWTWLVGALALATLVLGAAVLVSNAARVVTWAALQDAEGYAAKLRSVAVSSDLAFLEINLFQPRPIDRAIDESREALAKRYGPLFRAGYFDHAYLVERVPPEGFTPEAIPPGLLILAYFTAVQERLSDVLAGPPADEGIIEEILRWAHAVFRSARAKESLVSLLTRDYEPSPGRKEPGNPLKIGLFFALTFRDPDDYGWGEDTNRRAEKLANRVLLRLGADDWSAVLDHCRHAAENVRAGALLLLCHHPEREVFVSMARFALQDPSFLVRLAAAGTLAYHGESSGAASLREGLAHERWEIRWWCAKSLAYLGGTESGDAIAARLEVEPDSWLKGELRDVLRSFRHKRGRTDNQ